MTKTEIELYISKLGFELTDGKSDHWTLEIDKYNLGIDLGGESSNKWKIDYGSEITVHRKTTSNFSQLENLVVLECVVRLLKKGYPAKNIELEKKWRVGGNLDIYVTDSKGKAYLMIECKTWGKEYNKALKITLENNTNKEQILNYYLQDQNAKYLCLYTSHLNSENNLDYNLTLFIHPILKRHKTKLKFTKNGIMFFTLKGFLNHQYQLTTFRF